MTTLIPSSPGFMNTLLSLVSPLFGKNSAAKMQSKQNSNGGINESVTVNGPVNVSNGGNTISGQGNTQVNSTTNNFSMSMTSTGDTTSDIIMSLLKDVGVRNTATDAVQDSSTATAIGGSKDSNTKAPKSVKKKRTNVLVSFCCFVIIGFYQHLTENASIYYNCLL